MCDGREKICRVTCYPTEALPPGSDPKWNFCTPQKWLCQEGEGDCDNDSECEEDLICAECPDITIDPGPDVDCCRQASALSKVVSPADLIEVFSTHI